MSPGNTCRPVASISFAAPFRSGAISTIRPSDTRMSAFTRPSGRTSVPPRTIVSITSGLEFVQECQSGIESRGHVVFADVLGWMMADAALAAEEQHAGRHLRGKNHRIVSGATRHSVGRSPRLLERA